MKGVGYFVLLKKKGQTVSNIGGLEITETQDETLRYVIGTVVLVGSLVTGVKEGDEVCYDKRSAHEDSFGNLVIKADAIAYIV